MLMQTSIPLVGKPDRKMSIEGRESLCRTSQCLRYIQMARPNFGFKYHPYCTGVGVYGDTITRMSRHLLSTAKEIRIYRCCTVVFWSLEECDRASFGC
jgi:hypothetical protein